MTAVVIVGSMVLLLTVAKALGAINWSRGRKTLRHQLSQESAVIGTKGFAIERLRQLPAPVQAFFQAAIIGDTPPIVSVQLTHHGQLNLELEKERWKRFVSDQCVNVASPGFDWDAKVSLFPGLSVNVRDAYVNGKGYLKAALLGLVQVGELEGGGQIAEGELMRFLAEAAWYPFALLPSRGVTWELCGPRSARATLIDQGNRASLLFEFNDDGLIETVDAEQRGRMVGSKLVPTPWRGRFWNYTQRNGMQVPLQGEVAWVIDGVVRPYWRGHLDRIEYLVE